MSGAMVPQLRFPGFAGEWEAKTLGDFMVFKNGVNAEKDQYGSGTKFINVLDIIAAGPIYHDKIIGRVEVSERELEKNDVRYGDVLFQRSSETREEVGQSNIYLDEEKVATFGGFVIRGRPIQDFNPRFFDGLLRTDVVRSDMTSRSGGSTRFNIGQDALSMVAVTVPREISEQQKIADFLGTVDAKLDALRLKKSGLEAFKSGLMQRLFSQELRFTRDDGTEFPEWEEKALADVLFEHRQKSVGDEPVFSVSVHRGLVDQVEHLGRRFAAASTGHYNRVLPGDVVYTKSPTGDFPMGIIKQSHADRDVIVSPLYGVFTPQTRDLGFILHCYFQSSINTANYLSPLVQKGAKNTIAVTNSRFLEGKLTLPTDPDEQRKIADALSTLDAKIAAVADQITHMETFKKGLLQQMFV